MTVAIEQGGYSYVKYVKYNGKPAIEKINKNFDYTMSLEAQILKCLRKLSSPHFPKLYEYKYNRNGDEVLYIEYIPGQTYFNSKLSDYESKSILIRTLIAAAIMNEKLLIVHNDLHTNNVIVRKTAIDVDVYTFPDNETFVIPTYCNEPVIIDFGLAYCGNCCDKMKTPLIFNYYGYFSFLHDSVGDVKRLLDPNNYTLPYELRQNIFKVLSNLPLQEGGYYISSELNDIYTEIKNILLSATYKLSHKKFKSNEKRCLLEPDDTGALVNIFTSQLSLPVEKPTKSYPVNDLSESWLNLINILFDVSSECKAFSTDNERTQFLKDILELSPNKVIKLYSNNPYIKTTKLPILKKECNRVINAIHWFVYDTKIRSEQFLYNEVYSKYTSVREIIRLINIKDNFIYTKGDVIRHYDVLTSKKKEITLKDSEAKLLNQNKINILDLFFNR